MFQNNATSPFSQTNHDGTESQESQHSKNIGLTLQGKRMIGREEPVPNPEHCHQGCDNRRTNSAVPRREHHRQPNCLVGVWPCKKRIEQSAKEQSRNYCECRKNIQSYISLDAAHDSKPHKNQWAGLSPALSKCYDTKNPDFKVQRICSTDL